MCGIAGSLGNNWAKNSEAQNERVHNMLAQMLHRGPDISQIVKMGAVTIGANRLSIVDRDKGNQPMSNSQSSLIIVFNGEVYNFRHLSNTILSDYRFRSGSDTETLLALFSELGLDSLNRLNGMFAFCVTDGITTYLVRDRLGIKPLYYKKDEEFLLFASEAKAFRYEQLELCNINIEETYDVFETNIGHTTLFSGVYEIPPGCYLKHDALSGTYSIHQYYSLEKIRIEHYSEKQAIEKMRWLVQDAINLRISTDISFGSYVSGGIDSSIVAILAQPKLLLSSVVRDEHHYNEEYYLEVLKQSLRTNVSIITPQPLDFKKYFVEMVYALDFPTATLASFVQFLLSKSANEQGYRIMLNGLGVDEYLGGYARHVGLLFDNAHLYNGGAYEVYSPLFVTTKVA